jgi:hypothetical protein
MLTIKLVLQVQQNVDLITEFKLDFISFYLNEIYSPIQLRDPAENGIKVNGERSVDVEEYSANRSGSNFSGSG